MCSSPSPTISVRATTTDSITTDGATESGRTWAGSNWMAPPLVANQIWPSRSVSTEGCEPPLHSVPGKPFWLPYIT